MKGKINPMIATILIVAAILIVGFIFVKQTTPPPPVKADPLGIEEGGKKGLTPDVQEIIKRQQQSGQGTGAPAGR